MSGYEKSPDCGGGHLPMNWRRVAVALCWIAVFVGAAMVGYTS